MKPKPKRPLRPIRPRPPRDTPPSPAAGVIRLSDHPHYYQLGPALTAAGWVPYYQRLLSEVGLTPHRFVALWQHKTHGELAVVVATWDRTASNAGATRSARQLITAYRPCDEVPGSRPA